MGRCEEIGIVGRVGMSSKFYKCGHLGGKGNKALQLAMIIEVFHPPTQETTALAVEECATLPDMLAAINLLCFGGFRTPANDPPKPWRRWVCFLGTTGLPVGLHLRMFR